MNVVSLVLAKGLAGVLVPLDHRRVMKTGIRHAYGEATRSSE
jgi:hypothetical protein